MQQEPTQREDWDHTPLPSTAIQRPFDYTVSFEELEWLRFGWTPASMEEKWFIFWETDVLYLHRSWTGDAVFALPFTVYPDQGAQAEVVHLAPTQDAESLLDLLPEVLSALLVRNQGIFARL